MRHRRRVAVGAAIVALASAVVLAHSAAAGDHMGEAMVACVAVMDAGALGVLILSTGGALNRVRAAGVPGSSYGRERLAARRPSAPPWPRGSPFALQVLRL